MLSIFRVMNVYSLFAVRYFADAPFYNCVSGRIGLQVARDFYTGRVQTEGRGWKWGPRIWGANPDQGGREI
jgi:hypothetical protein